MTTNERNDARMASKRKRRRDHCGNKRRLTRPEAIQLAGKLRKLNDSVLDAYPCTYCGTWHVGHRPHIVVPGVNASIHMSEVPEELLKRNPHVRFAAYYFDRADGKRQWGLRSVGDFDVSEVAKTLGGGGHKNAAGFTTVTP